jgi:hypothetical protein
LWSVIPGFGLLRAPGFPDAEVEDGGTEDGRRFVSPLLLPARISPLAVPSLFVKDEMAHPAHDVSFAGVPIRGALAMPAIEGDGKAVSGID